MVGSHCKSSEITSLSIDNNSPSSDVIRRYIFLVSCLFPKKNRLSIFIARWHFPVKEINIFWRQTSSDGTLRLSDDFRRHIFIVESRCEQSEITFLWIESNITLSDVIRRYIFLVRRHFPDIRLCIFIARWTFQWRVYHLLTSDVIRLHFTVVRRLKTSHIYCWKSLCTIRHTFSVNWLQFSVFRGYQTSSDVIRHHIFIVGSHCEKS